MRRLGLLGKKLGMTQIFTENGDRVPVTVIDAGSCVVLAKKTIEKDGYAALQLGYGEKPLRLANKAELGLAKKLEINPVRVVEELRLEPAQLDQSEVGKTVPLSTIFTAGTYLDVTGVTKGKGFQGVIKRHKMGGTRASHGTHEFFRHGGSIGCRMTPGRVHKGKRMTGHMGSVQRTVQNIALMQIIEESGLLLVRGAVPGGKNAMVMLKNALKKQGPVRFGDAVEDTKAKKGAAKPKPAAKKK